MDPYNSPSFGRHHNNRKEAEAFRKNHERQSYRRSSGSKEWDPRYSRDSSRETPPRKRSRLESSRSRERPSSRPKSPQNYGFASRDRNREPEMRRSLDRSKSSNSPRKKFQSGDQPRQGDCSFTTYLRTTTI